jgi:hypothetical protein
MRDTILFRGIKLFLVAAAMIAGMALLASPANAGVGMLQQDENLYVSDLSFRGGSKYWDVQRNVIDSICKRRNVNLVQGYEYGYSYFHTIFANVTFAYRKCGEINRAAAIRRGGINPGTPLLGGQAAGVGDVELGVRTRFNNKNTAAWEALLLIPTGYNNNSPSRLGRGALGLGLGVKFSSSDRSRKVSAWGWRLGSRFTYYFSGKGNTLRTFASLLYAFTDSNFEQSGDFLKLRLTHLVGFARNGVQKQLFFNQVPSSMTNFDQTKLELSYSHSFGNGWSTSIRAGKYFFGRNSPIDYVAGWGFSYRWRD